ncbi:MAG: hypothetical protein WKF85_10285 [Chitinophagaceae bacterium]
MKKRLITFGSLFICLSCICGMCSKDDVVSLVPDDLVGKFKISGYTLVSNGISTNYFATRPSCVKDNIITYSRDYMVSLDEGATKCDPSDPQLVSAKFTLDGQKINTYTGDEGDDLDEGTILSVSASGVLVISFVGGSPGDSAIITYQKQP